MITIRNSEISDLPELLRIYNYEVENGVATLDIHPQTTEERKRWFDAHGSANHPLVTAVEDGEIAGYASLSSYRDKEAYSSTVELSVYVAPEHRRRGVAVKLMEYLVDFARNDPSTHCVVSVITAGNEASVKLHEKFGFTYSGTIPEVGEKFGRYLDIVNYALIVK